ncbi:isochorismate synthase [Flavobacterium sp. SM2513]|uniref:isochorismate synthase n=1 Tax=Flavobacterium sp. SM2513 TaxID=3424766 RepID=UPI003D7FEEBB
MANILKKVVRHFEQKLPFVVYSKPNSTQLTGFFQQNCTLYEVNDFSEMGFVFSNFKENQSILFPEKECEILQEEYILKSEIDEVVNSEVSTVGKERFELLVKKGIKAIEEGVFDKVVLSRKETLEFERFNFLEVFQKMLSKYPTAFRYCWFYPEIGMWLGASPEQLLKVEAANFETVALAGTQKWNPNSETIWQEKERKEQQFVTDFIVSELQDEVDSLYKSNPYTFQAGNIVHLKTDIKGVFKSDYNLKNIIGILHPTPAVCGLPKEKAKQFVLRNEGYDRKFYAGYLGELNLKANSDLFVNLRCMEIRQNQVHLYIGCGITKDSDPEKEYFETANKAMTMKQILK